MYNPEISTAEAKQDKLFYVVANIVIVNPADRTCLLLKRSDTEKVHPEKWAFPGGKLEHKDVTDLLISTGNDPVDGIENILGILAMREGKEECGLDVSAENATVIKNKVFIRPDGVPVLMTTLATTYQGGAVAIEKGAFSDCTWATAHTLEKLDCIPGVQEEAKTALSLFL